MRQECDRKVEDIFSDPGGLKERPEARASQLLGVCSSLMTDRKKRERDRGRPTASNLCLESMLLSSISNFVNGVAQLVGDRFGVHLVGLTWVLYSASDSLELSWSSIVEFSSAVEQECRLLTAIHGTS